MQQAIIGLTSLCILAAVCGQIMNRSRYSGVIRMALGLEITRTLYKFLNGLVQGIIEWS